MPKLKITLASATKKKLPLVVFECLIGLSVVISWFSLIFKFSTYFLVKKRWQLDSVAPKHGVATFPRCCRNTTRVSPRWLALFLQRTPCRANNEDSGTGLPQFELPGVIFRFGGFSWRVFSALSFRIWEILVLWCASACAGLERVDSMDSCSRLACPK